MPASIAGALVIPPTAASSAALKSLGAMAGKGHCVASGSRVRYLMDLLDAARLYPRAGAASPDEATANNPGDAALALLWTALGLPGEAGRGRLATGQVITVLEDEITSVPKQCPQQALARAAQLLLDTDRAPRVTAKQTAAAALVYKKLARSGSPLAANARLRLVDWCYQAFALAAGGIPARQHARLIQCLAPLFDADPSPYLRADPALRPPDPPWPVLREALLRELKALAGTRFKVLGAALSQHATALLSRAAPLLPTPLDLSRISLPRQPGSPPWDRTPVVLATSAGYFVGGRAVLADDPQGLRQAIYQRLAGDRRGRVTLVANPDTSAAQVTVVGRAARLAGARQLDLGVAAQVARKAPGGDVQRRVFGDQPVLRLHGVPLSLALLAARTAPRLARDRPRALDHYDSASAPNSLSLRLGRGSARVSSVHGTLLPQRLDQLLPTLRELRQAYPEDTALMLVAGPGVTYTEVVAVAAMTRRDPKDGSLLFPGVALAPAALAPPPQTDLAPALRLLTRAQVTVTPALGRALLTKLRRCYRRALGQYLTAGSEGAAPAGKVNLRARSGRGGARTYAVAPRGVRQRGLMRCTSLAVSSQTYADPPPRAVITFKLNSQPQQ